MVFEIATDTELALNRDDIKINTEKKMWIFLEFSKNVHILSYLNQNLRRTLRKTFYIIKLL